MFFVINDEHHYPGILEHEGHLWISSCQMPTAHYPDHVHHLLTEWRDKVCGCQAAEVFVWARKPVRCSTTISGNNAPILDEVTTKLIQDSR